MREAVAWLTAAFDFAERLRIGENHRSQLSVGAGAVIVADVRYDRRPPRPDEETHSVLAASRMPARIANVRAPTARGS